MRLAHTMIRVRNLDKSIEFYCGFLGLQEIRRKDLGDEAILVFLTDENKKDYEKIPKNKIDMQHKATVEGLSKLIPQIN